MKDVKKALVFFNQFSPSIGGSEYLALTVVRALQATHDVTLAVNDCLGDVRELTAPYGVRIDWDRVRFVNLRPSGWLAVLDRHLKFVRQRRLRRLGPAFDVCISCSNPADFGRPAVHFVFMLSFDHLFHAWAQNCPTGPGRWLWRRLVALRDVAVARLFGFRTARQLLADPAETVLPNSAFARAKIETYYRCRTAEVFFPPTLFETDLRNSADRSQIGCLGRVCPEKRVLELVGIVREARRLTGRDLVFRIAGVVEDSAYGGAVRRLAKENAWVILEGPVSGEAKKRFLASVALALHGRRAEEFGIAVTEYLKAGVVPVVPKEGGVREVLADDALCYESDGEAAALLARLCTDEAFYVRSRAKGAERAGLFASAAYLKRQDEILRRVRT